MKDRKLTLQKTVIVIISIFIVGELALLAVFLLRQRNGNKALPAAAPVETRVYVVKTFEDLPAVLAELLANSDFELPPMGSDLSEISREFFSNRVIVKARQMDYSAYTPTIVIEGPDGLWFFQFRTAEEARDFTEDMKNDSGNVVFAEPDRYEKIIDPRVPTEDEVPVVLTESHSWGTPYLGADSYALALAAAGTAGEVTVAVVDCGVDMTHPFFVDRLTQGYDFVENDEDPNELGLGVGHGTHVSGIIVDCTPGLNVKIMPIRVLDESGSGGTTAVAAGIIYAVSNGAEVINLSVGGTHSALVDEAIAYALQNGVTVCVAAGNEGGDVSGCCPGHIDLSGCISVAAIDAEGRRAEFSNYGDAVDLAAPGVAIVSSIPGGDFAALDGTSMATPHISALAAMLKLRNPSLLPAQIEEALKSAAEDIAPAGEDPYTGAGVPHPVY